MHYSDENDPREETAAFDRHPGPIAVADPSVESATVSVTTESHDDQPWAVQVGYLIEGREVLVVRTVVPWEDLDPYGLTVEDLPSVVLRYAANQPGAGPPVKRRDPRAVDDWFAQRAAVLQHTRADLARLPETPITVPIDGVETRGVRIDPPGASAVRLRWDTQTVFCVGDPNIVEQLRLRRAVPEDLRPPAPADPTEP
jgi:hypothetical protein